MSSDTIAGQRTKKTRATDKAEKAAAENGLLKDNKNNKTIKDMGKVKTQELTDVERERIVKALTLYAEEAEKGGHPTVQHNCETLAQRIERGKVIIYTIN